MKTSDFNFDLPEELIAQTPIEPRDHSRLMVLDKATGAIEHRHFYDIIDYLTSADCLVLNDSRVLPARIYGVKEGTGAHVEFLLLQNKGGDVWEALAGPGKRAKKGSRFSFGDGLLHCEVVDVLPDGNRLIHFEYEGVFFHLLDQIGQMPLPPYIKARAGGQGALPDRVLPGGGLGSGPHGGAALHPGAAGAHPSQGRGAWVRHPPRGAGHLPAGERGGHPRPQDALGALLHAPGHRGPYQQDQGAGRPGHRRGYHQLPHHRSPWPSGRAAFRRAPAGRTSSSIPAAPSRGWTPSSPISTCRRAR